MIPKLNDYFQLLRVKHYIKNLLIFLPLFWGRKIFDGSKLKNVLVGGLAFCLMSSGVYIFNDWKDKEKDRKHLTKKNRPIASGRVGDKQALFFAFLSFAGGVFILIQLENVIGTILVLIYVLLNIAYSLALKNKPIIDIIILTSGFVIRALFGAALAQITVSKWLYLVIIAGSFYMGMGKRRNEAQRQAKETREVLQYYSCSFLDRNMYMCAGLVNVFYALWAMEHENIWMFWTVPVFMIILMRYSLDIEGDSDGDPVEVILRDKVLITMIIFYVITVFLFLYVINS